MRRGTPRTCRRWVGRRLEEAGRLSRHVEVERLASSDQTGPPPPLPPAAADCWTTGPSRRPPPAGDQDLGSFPQTAAQKKSRATCRATDWSGEPELFSVPGCRGRGDLSVTHAPLLPLRTKGLSPGLPKGLEAERYKGSVQSLRRNEVLLPVESAKETGNLFYYLSCPRLL